MASSFSTLPHIAGRLLALTAGPTGSPSGGPAAGGSPAGPDIRAIVPPQPYFLSSSSLWLIVAAVCLVLAGLLAWYLFSRPAKPKPPVPPLGPREAANRRLAELEAQMETMDARTFGGEVCEVLRAFIGGEFGLHPERQTSPEFLNSVASSRVFSRQEHTLLGEFLTGCDLLKFARADATLDRKRDLLAQAREFIAGSAAPPPQPPPLPPPQPPPLPRQPAPSRQPPQTAPAP